MIQLLIWKQNNEKKATFDRPVGAVVIVAGVTVDAIEGRTRILSDEFSTFFINVDNIFVDLKIGRLSFFSTFFRRNHFCRLLLLLFLCQNFDWKFFVDFWFIAVFIDRFVVYIVDGLELDLMSFLGTEASLKTKIVECEDKV